MEISQLIRFIQTMREDLGSEISSQALEVLLRVAQSEGITQKEICQPMGLSTGTMSRHMAKLGYYEKAGKLMGMGLIVQHQDPLEWRSKRCYLTNRGRDTIAHALKETVNGQTKKETC